MRTVILSNPSPAHLLQLIDNERKHGPVEIVGQAPGSPATTSTAGKRRVGRPRKLESTPAAAVLTGAESTKTKRVMKRSRPTRRFSR